MSNQPRNPFTGGGGPIAKFENVGDSAGGTITKVEYKDATDVDGKVRTFEDGSPRPCIIVYLDTGGEEEVRDFVQGRSVSLFRDKVWAVEGEHQEPKVGASYKRTLVGKTPPTKRGHSPEKVFEIEYGNTSPTSDDRGDLV
jgi:hypothetical protein